MFLYLAAPLFNQAELAFNELLTVKIEKLGFDGFSPLEHISESVDELLEYLQTVI